MLKVGTLYVCAQENTINGIEVGDICTLKRVEQLPKSPFLTVTLETPTGDLKSISDFSLTYSFKEASAIPTTVAELRRFLEDLPDDMKVVFYDVEADAEYLAAPRFFEDKLLLG